MTEHLRVEELLKCTLRTSPNLGKVSRLNETWQVCTNLLTHDCVMLGVAGWGEKKPFEVQMHALFSSFFFFQEVGGKSLKEEQLL